MHFTTEYKDKTDAITALFVDSFTTSEGAEEGQLIGALAANMLTTLDPDDMRVFSAVEGASLLGCIIFTRMTYDQDARTVFILSPVAVSPGQQGKGLGQRLIRHALHMLRDEGVHIALTYGDIAFYAKTGFHHITERDAKAPQPLQYPEGWLGQSLEGAQFEPLAGPSYCVAPLNDPNLW